MEPILPEGWKSAINQKNNKRYYYNSVTKENTYQPPPGTKFPTATPDSSDLPPEWSSQVDQRSGKVYYFNRTTKQTSWTKPTIAPPLEPVKEQVPVIETLPEPAQPQEPPTPSLPPPPSALPSEPEPPQNLPSLPLPPENLPPPPGNLPPPPSDLPPLPADLPPPPTGLPPPPGDLPPPPTDLPPPPTDLPPPPADLTPALQRRDSVHDIAQPPTQPKPAALRRIVSVNYGHTPLNFELLEKAKSNASVLSSASQQGSATRTIPTNLKEEISAFKMTGFAKQHFQEQKTGRFKKKIVPLSKLLVFQSTPLSNPLLKSVPAKQVKEALKNFDDILIFIGVKPTKLPASLSAQRIIQRGQNIPTLRDEIYAQMCKQTNTTVKEGDDAQPEPLPFDQREKAWQLMMLCCDSFAPSRDFERTLLASLDEVISSGDDSKDGMSNEERLKVIMYAQFSLGKLQATVETGGKVAPTFGKGMLKKTGKDEVDSAVTNALSELQNLHSSKKVFGCTLEDVIFRQAQPNFIDFSQTNGFNFDVTQFQIPFILVYLTQLVIKSEALKVEGVFRRSVDFSEIEEDVKLLNRGVYKLPSTNPLTFSVLVKNLFKVLPIPAIPYSIYDRAIQVVRGTASKDPNMATIIGVKDLPESDLTTNVLLFAEVNLSPLTSLTLKYLMRLLRQVVLPDNKSTNRMDVNNLAIIFTPSLMRMNSDNPKECIKNLADETSFVFQLIQSLSPTEEEEALFQQYDQIANDFINSLL
ncbi:putative Rho GTPase-activating protein 39 [Blattamonas nauphoetae]|uniref:Rho GTPase-activating protein 39 n=1 Tax=Blattamonas nauphoetae TaxID=2049346 RepID=A0ABQ9YH93_9EUKA|nr:putative Rho GTPase-activating protein 39 [Blattamonas nauphoetae]